MTKPPSPPREGLSLADVIRDLLTTSPDFGNEAILDAAALEEFRENPPAFLTRSVKK